MRLHPRRPQGRDPGAGPGWADINQSQGFFGGAFSTNSGQPDNGTYTMPKASGLKPGAGWIILYRSLVSAPTGTGFKSATVVDDAAATGVEVQWL